MSDQNDYATPGSRGSQKLITIMGAIIGAAWLIGGILTTAGLVTWENSQSYLLGAGKGLLLLQLISYSFIGFGALSLAFKLIWLAGIVDVARHALSPAGFIRIYSLGTIGSGLIYLLIYRWMTGEQGTLSDSYLALITMHGALAILAPRSQLFDSYKSSFFVSIFYDSIFYELRWRLVISGIVIDLFVLKASPGIHYILWIVTVMIMLRYLAAAPLLMSAIVWLALDLAEGLILALQNWGPLSLRQLSFFLAQVAGFTLGILYGYAEKLWKKHGAKWQGV